MNVTNKMLFFLLMFLIVGCTSTSCKPGSVEMNLQKDDTKQSKLKTFNQFHNEWSY